MGIIFKDRVVEHPGRYIMTNNEDGTITLTQSPGAVIEPGTPLNASNLNGISIPEVGAIKQFPIYPGEEWLLCNGDVVDATLYPELAKILKSAKYPITFSDNVNTSLNMGVSSGKAFHFWIDERLYLWFYPTTGSYAHFFIVSDDGTTITKLGTRSIDTSITSYTKYLGDYSLKEKVFGASYISSGTYYVYIEIRDVVTGNLIKRSTMYGSGVSVFNIGFNNNYVYVNYTPKDTGTSPKTLLYNIEDVVENGLPSSTAAEATYPAIESPVTGLSDIEGLFYKISNTEIQIGTSVNSLLTYTFKDNEYIYPEFNKVDSKYYTRYSIDKTKRIGLACLEIMDNTIKVTPINLTGKLALSNIIEYKKYPVAGIYFLTASYLGVTTMYASKTPDFSEYDEVLGENKLPDWINDYFALYFGPNVTSYAITGSISQGIKLPISEDSITYIKGKE